MAKGTAIEKAPTEELSILKQYSAEELTVIKSTVGKDITNETELKFCLTVAKRAGLDVLQGQVYFFKSRGAIKAIASVDGLQARAESFPDWVGGNAVAVCEQDDFQFDGLKGTPTKHTWGPVRGRPVGAYYRILRKDMEPFFGWVAFSEFTTGQNNWHTMPTVMIEKVARSTGLRRAFPTAFQGIYGEEEMSRGGAVAMAEVVAPPALDVPPPAPGDPVDPVKERDVLKDKVRTLAEHEALKQKGFSLKAKVKEFTGKDVSGTGGLTVAEMEALIKGLEGIIEDWEEAKATPLSPPLEGTLEPREAAEPPLPASPPAQEPPPPPPQAPKAEESASKGSGQASLLEVNGTTFDSAGKKIELLPCKECWELVFTDSGTGEVLDRDIKPHTCKKKTAAPRKSDKPMVETGGEKFPCQYCGVEVQASLAKRIIAGGRKPTCSACAKKILSGEMTPGGR